MNGKRSKLRVKFYRNKYLIGIYEDGEWLVGIYDNTRDLAKVNGMKLNTVSKALSQIFHKKRDKLYIDGKGYDVSFIELTDYDLKLFSERGLI